MANKKKRKKISLGVITAFAWLIVLALLIIVYRSAISARIISLKRSVVNSSVYINIFPLPSNKSKIISLSKAWQSDLKTYTNTTYGFTFQYPSYLLIKEAYVPHDPVRDYFPDHYFISVSTPEFPDIKTEDNYHDWEEKNYACINSFYLSILIFPNVKSITVKDFLRNKTASYEDVLLADHLAQVNTPIKDSYFFSGTYLNSQHALETTYFKYKNNIYSFTSDNGCGDLGSDLSQTTKKLYMKIIDSISLN